MKLNLKKILFPNSRCRIVDYVPYQKCPVCNGDGKVKIGKTQVLEVCRVCAGGGVIPMHVINIVKE